MGERTMNFKLTWALALPSYYLWSALQGFGGRNPAALPQSSWWEWENEEKYFPYFEEEKYTYYMY